MIAIFSDIEIDEVKEIIETQIVDLRKIIFKRSWINESEGNFNIFWDKVIKAHKVLKEKVKKPEGFSDVVKKVESKTDEEENKKEEDLEKATKRKECLSEIEYNKIKLFFSNGLRIRSISRVLGVLFFFLCYGGASYFFNYYMHYINQTAVDMFFILNRRTIDTCSLSTFLKQTIADGNIKWISYNTGKLWFLNIK